MLFGGTSLRAQTSTLALSSASGSAGATVPLNLSLTSTSTQPATLEWRVSYPTASVTSVSVSVGSAAVAASKSVTCSASSGSALCLLWGLNQTAIANGTVAVVSVTLAASATGTVPIAVTGVSAAAANGTAISAAGTSGTITVTAGTGGGGGSGGGGSGGGGSGGGGGGGGTPPPPTLAISALNCPSSFLPASTSASCIVTLSTVAPTGGLSISITSDNAALTVPAQLSIAAGLSSASFMATASAGAAGQTATLTATLGGTQPSSQSVSVSITAPSVGPTVSSLVCLPGSFTAAGSATCTVTLSAAAPSSGSVVTITNSSAVVTTPPSIAIPAGTSSGAFTAVVGAFTTSQSVLITAALNGASQSVAISLSVGQGAGPVSSLTCSPDPTALNTLDCTAQLATAAPAGGASLTLQSASSQITMPTLVQVPAGAQTVQFKATVTASDQDQRINITAALNGATSTLQVAVLGVRPTSVTCPGTVVAGSAATCVVALNATNVPAVARLTLASTSSNLKMPASMTSRPRQTRMTFVVNSDPLAPQQSSTISVQFGSTTVTTAVAIQPAAAPVLTLPGDQAVVAGNPLSFTVSAADPGGQPVILSTGTLPAGAAFDPNSGTFSWTPAAAQQGVYTVAFTATDSSSASSTANLTVYVVSGVPVVTGIVNAASQAQPACSPHSVASVLGRWLASVTQPVSDLTGASTALGGSQVLVNGTAVPVLTVTPKRIDFLCPSSSAGTLLNVSVQTGAGSSAPAQTTMQAVSLGLFSSAASGQGQGVVFLAGTSLLATSRTYLNLGQPAEPGDAITIRITGMGAASSALPMVKFGDLFARADSVNPVVGMAGVEDIAVTVPPGVADGQAVPIIVVDPLSQAGSACTTGLLSPGTWPTSSSGTCTSGARTGDPSSSNTITAAIESGS